MTDLGVTLAGQHFSCVTLAPHPTVLPTSRTMVKTTIYENISAVHNILCKYTVLY